MPREWNIRDAWIKNSAGERLVDFQKLNLHVVNYSVPVRRQMNLAQLQGHFLPCRVILNGFPIALPITRKPGVFA